ncbi:MAG: hypothetical protein KJ726_08660 [Verrucomicrobia bacterium]|nr:hypothetical protein [Verrucomicrobiota bacterium]
MIWNSAGALAGLAATWLTGYFLIRRLLGLPGWGGVALGWLLVSGLTSLAVFFIYLCGGTLLPWLPVVQGVLLAAVLVLHHRGCVGVESAEAVLKPARTWRPGAILMILLLAFLLGAAGIKAITTPALRFDEVHNWGFKSLSTAVHGRPFQGEWPFMLFPNLMPFLTASFLVYQGDPRETIAHMIPFLFLVAAAGALYAGAQRLSGKAWWGLPMTILLLFGAPELMVQSDRFCADLPLTALHLASVVAGLIWLTGGPAAAAALSGVFAGLGAWTKTEGILLAAGVGAGLLLAALLRPKEERRPWLHAALLWMAGFALVAGPWSLYLKFRGVDMQSSGHLSGEFNPERWGRLFVHIRTVLLRHFRIPLLAFFLFLALGFRRRTRAVYVFLLVTLVLGWVHLWLPILLMPGDAFGGWIAFMKSGMTRYVLHIAPVMLLSLAAVARADRLKGLDALFRRLNGGRVPGNVRAPD